MPSASGSRATPAATSRSPVPGLVVGMDVGTGQPGSRVVRPDVEPGALEDAVVVGHPAAGVGQARVHGGDGRAHLRLELREGVQDGGDEHVPGQTAARIEVDFHGEGS